jgi:hypothetical protein
MPETKSIIFTHKEVAEALIKQQGIHEGLWGIYFEFGFGAGNIGPVPGDPNLLPTAIVQITKIGIQRFPEENNLTIDASVSNPIIKKSIKKTK